MPISQFSFENQLNCCKVRKVDDDGDDDDDDDEEEEEEEEEEKEEDDDDNDSDDNVQELHPGPSRRVYKSSPYIHIST